MIYDHHVYSRAAYIDNVVGYMHACRDEYIMLLNFQLFFLFTYIILKIIP